jgi:hypothetical protein
VRPIKIKQYNASLFQGIWRESLKTLSIRKGPKCLRRIEPLSIDTKLVEEDSIEDDKIRADSKDKSKAPSKEGLLNPFIKEE